MISKQDIIKMYQKECATTIKVMQAYPKEHKTFKPHERSSDIIKLLSTFVFEAYLLDGYLFDGNTDSSRFFGYKPAGLEEIILDFKKETEHILTEFKNMPESTLQKTINFAGQNFTGDDFVMMMLFDQIHHRGQLSVYVRLAGGLVPSIYGPSADDKSTNL